MDIFNGRIYRGGRWVRMYRDLDSIPVLAGEGAIVPMYRSGDTNDLSLEQPLEIHIWRGNGRFELYEDDGETLDHESGKSAITVFETDEAGEGLTLNILPPSDSHGLLPATRQMYLNFRDVVNAEVFVDGVAVPFSRAICVTVGAVPVRVELKNVRVMDNEPREELRINLLTRVQAGNSWKGSHFGGKKPMPKYIQDALDELENLI